MNTKERGLNILFVSAEVVPFAKTGGLADVAGSLPIELVQQGHDVRIVMPKYKKISSTMNYVTDFPVQINNRQNTCIIRQSSIEYSSTRDSETLPVYFVDNYQYFNRDSIYGYSDEAERFAFFCLSVVNMLPKINFKPDVIHCNDWQTGPICMLIKEKFTDEFYEDISTIFTIHNLQYQGNFPKHTIGLFDLGSEYLTPDKLEFYDSFSYMKCGIQYADIINTVSDTYAKEIQTSEYGERMEGLLKKRSNSLFGILNGISYNDFNPKTDTRIYKNYSLDTLNKKYENKYSLQRELELPVRKVAVIGLISRLVDQKGLDIIAEIMDDIMSMDLQFILLGSGEPYYEELFRTIKTRYPDKMSANIGFNATLAQRIYAGCDMFLMPSRFEPCGLGQLISLRYGTIPIVRATGGLADTIKDISNGDGNGFSFWEYSGQSLLKTIERALDIYYNHPDEWDNLIRTAFRMDFSWGKSAQEYLKLYNMAQRHSVNSLV